MSDEYHRHAAGLGKAKQRRSTLPDLCDRAGTRFDVLRHHRLDRVDHHQFGLHVLDMVEHIFERVLTENEEVVVIPAQPIGAHFQLVGALLTADIENLLFRQAEHRLQGQCTLANARFATQQHDAARHQTTTEHAVQLFVVHVDARVIMVGDVLQLQHLVLPQGVPSRCGSRGSGLLLAVASHTDLLKRVPLSAGRTFPDPLRRLLAAVGANVCNLVFCHIECKVTKS